MRTLLPLLLCATLMAKTVESRFRPFTVQVPDHWLVQEVEPKVTTKFHSTMYVKSGEQYIYENMGMVDRDFVFIDVKTNPTPFNNISNQKGRQNHLQSLKNSIQSNAKKKRLPILAQGEYEKNGKHYVFLEFKNLLFGQTLYNYLVHIVTKTHTYQLSAVTLDSAFLEKDKRVLYEIVSSFTVR